MNKEFKAFRLCGLDASFLVDKTGILCYDKEVGQDAYFVLNRIWKHFLNCLKENRRKICG